MPILAIILDLIAFGGYFLQHLYPGHYGLGFIFQFVVMALLVLVTKKFYQREFAGTRPAGYRYPTIRFSVILLSVLINGMVAILYLLNLLGITPLVFTGWH